jgi:serine/threonine protein kinase
MTVEDLIQALRKRPDRKARQRRLFAALDSAMPHWENFIVRSRFKMWANWRNPHTGKTRVDILRTLTFGNFDGLNAARLLKTAQNHLDVLQRRSPTFTDPVGLLEPGSVIDNRYEVMLPLGRGGCGDVLMVYSHEVEEFFALKRIRPELLTDEGSRARFLREANLWVDLGNHENIVRAEFVDKLGDEVAILMELVDPDSIGRVSLQNHLSKNTTITSKRVAEWTVDICRGMAHAHSMGIKAHRDLKPDNVLITIDGKAKVTDFGISSLHQPFQIQASSAGSNKVNVSIAETQENIILGTLPYMSPEQFLNARDCDERSDIYSFGVVLYELLSSGGWPYGDINSLLRGVHPGDMPRLFYQVHSRKTPKFRFSRFYKIAKKCLSKTADSRPNSFDVLESMLRDTAKELLPEIATEKEQTHFDPWETGRKAASLLRLGRFEEALALFDEILEKFPIGTQWEFDKALTLSKLNRNDEALALYSKILKRDPSDLRALINKGLLCQDLGNLDEAQKLYSIALEHHPNDLNALINLGSLAFERKNYLDACEYYGRVVKLDIRNVTGWYNMGLACSAAEMNERANNCFELFLECADPLDSRREYAKRFVNNQMNEAIPEKSKEF